MNKTNRMNGKSKTVTVTVLAAGILMGTYLLVAWSIGFFPFGSDDATVDPGTHFVNLDKTDAEKRAHDNLQENPQDKLQNNQNDKPPQPDKNTETGKQAASVLITNAGVFNGKVSASGFISNVVETDGTCVYTFAKGAVRIVKTVNTLPSASSTTCETVSFDANELESAGTWTVVLSYSSDLSAGKSPLKEFQK